MNKLENNNSRVEGPEKDKKPEQSAAHANHVPKNHNKPFAYAAFHLTNFLGLHVLLNSTVSLFIAYNLLPTRPAKALMDGLVKIATPINAAFNKVTTPVFKFVRGNAYKVLTEEEIAAKVAHSARSRVETAFMCIAGFVPLWPVKWLEDHRAGFMNTVDRIIHPGRSEAERKAKEVKPEDTPKETWKNLIQARFIGLGVVFAVDALQQRFNNFLTYEKGNIDTAVWKWGANTFDNLSEKIRDKFVNFFTRKNITLTGIQSDMLPHLLRTINGKNSQALHDLGKDLAKLQDQIKKTPDKTKQNALKEEITSLMTHFNERHPELKTEVERAIFAEQSRLLFTKELFLTLLISSVIYLCAKTPVTRKALEKVGLRKKEHPVDFEPTAATDIPHDETTQSSSHAQKVVKAKPIEKHKKNDDQPFTQRLMQEAEIGNAQQLTV